MFNIKDKIIPYLFINRYKTNLHNNGYFKILRGHNLCSNNSM